MYRPESFASFFQDTCSPITSQGTISPWEHKNHKENMSLSPLAVPLVEAWSILPYTKMFRVWIGSLCKSGAGRLVGQIDVSLSCFSLFQNKTNKTILQWGLNSNMGLKGRTASTTGRGEIWPLSRYSYRVRRKVRNGLF